MLKKRLLISILFTLVGLAIIFFVSYRAVKEAYRSRQIEKEIDAMKQEAEKIRRDNKDLEEKIGYFQTQEFQEWEAKEKLNFQKENESVVIVRPSPSNIINKNETVQDNQENNDEELSNYRKWWNYFFKY